MKIEEVISILIEQNYENVTIEDTENALYGSNLQLFIKSEKVIFLKEFRTESSFYKWVNDQSIIASYYDYFTGKQKKNLYFFIVLDFNFEGEDLSLEINKIEKDSYVCKKYILQNTADLSKIPFLINQITGEVSFDYIKTFKETITNIEILHRDEPLLEHLNRSQYEKTINSLVDLYFKQDFVDYEDEVLHTKILEALEIGDGYDNK
ncbi:hypothetical protein GCM10008986_24780 [Salinibacillus aidingensis]|uniref:Uncharacterized protein n=1 Tax=Salinibacillus aidingensis TaxID=237684 RepID=A0ABP3LAU0_9BACI